MKLVTYIYWKILGVGTTIQAFGLFVNYLFPRGIHSFHILSSPLLS